MLERKAQREWAGECVHEEGEGGREGWDNTRKETRTE
jgi:hypothetical protein